MGCEESEELDEFKEQFGKESVSVVNPETEEKYRKALDDIIEGVYGYRDDQEDQRTEELNQMREQARQEGNLDM